MSDDTKQTQEVKAKRTAKNSVFLDLFQDKKNLLALYQTLHPEDTDATEDTLDIVTIDNVLTDNLYNDLGIMVGNHKLLLLLEAQYLSSKEVEVVTIMMSLFDDEQIMRTYAKDIKRETLMENAKHMLKMGKLTVEEIPICYPDLTIDDAKTIEEEMMQFA